MIAGLVAAAGLFALVGGGTAGANVPPPGFVELISVSSGGAQGNGDSQGAALTGDGRFVAFSSQASNLVAGDTNAAFDVFLRDRRGDTTERVSVGPLGEQGNNNSGLQSKSAISADGRFVAFSSAASNFAGTADTNGNEDVFVRDRLLGTTELISVGLDGMADEGSEPSISADGRYVSFTSFGDNLVPGDDNFASDIFVRDRLLGTTERVSVKSDGSEVSQGSFSSQISGDGRVVAFDSFSDDLVPGDTNESVDVFVHDRQTGSTEGVSTRTSCNPSQGDICGNSLLGSLTSDGSFVAFSSTQQGLVPGDDDFFSDAFVVDRQTDSIALVSQSSTGVKGNDDSVAPLVRADGQAVVFSSRASNLVPNDTNQQQDVFRRELVTGVTKRIAADTHQFAFPITADAITPDAQRVALETRAALRPEPSCCGFFTSDVYLLKRK
jgi:Tol biopolymer transport system component